MITELSIYSSLYEHSVVEFSCEMSPSWVLALVSLEDVATEDAGNAELRPPLTLPNLDLFPRTMLETEALRMAFVYHCCARPLVHVLAGQRASLPTLPRWQILSRANRHRLWYSVINCLNVEYTAHLVDWWSDWRVYACAKGTQSSEGLCAA